MVSLVTQTQVSQTKPLASTTPPKTTKTSIFYINDEHSQIPNMQKLKTASDQFDSFTPSEKTDKLKFSSGDFGLGTDVSLNKLAVAAQNSMGIMASAGGNHEFDINEKDLVNILKDKKYKIMGFNVEIPTEKPLDKELDKDITKSYIQEQNGTKYGVIGLFPFDFAYHLTEPEHYKHLGITPIEKAIPQMQQEIENLKKQGVDKIVVLSHAGYDSDVQIAKNVEGIDVILGGHTHNLIKGVQEGKNLFYSPKTGEPTIITQAGKDGKYFGVLNLEFDDKGVITKAQNNVSETENYTRSPILRYLTNKILGPAEKIGQIKSAQKAPKNPLVEENANLNFIGDAINAELGTDIALLNSGNIRGNLETGTVTTRDVEGLIPFKDKMCIVKLNEKELVDAIKVGAKSLNNEGGQPGILQFAGVKYTMTKSGEVKTISYVDKNGKETPIDVKNPNPFKTYRVGMDDFIARGGNDYVPRKWENAEAKFNYDKDKLTIDYIKKLNKPVEIKTEGRIQIVD